MNRPSLLPPLLIACALAAGGARAQEGGSLTVAFTDIKTPRGAILAAVFDREAAYRGEGAPVRSIMLLVTGQRAETVVKGLPPGRYAITAFHDVDGDGKMKMNPFGIPLEPFAFSNGAQARMGPPSWEEAAFTVGEGANVQSLAIDASLAGAP
jgi:uncharacterized protein (DUF2141 family)